jgi:peptidylamidoglycolate lyase
MPFKKISYTLLFLIGILLAFYFLQDKKIAKQSIPMYELVPNWPQLPEGFILGNPTGIGIDTSQNIFVFHRADRSWPLSNIMPDNFIASKTILVLDRETGKIIDSWGEHFFIMPHGLKVDKQNNVWVTDVGLHQVFKFTHEGKLLLKIGEAKVAGKDATHFNMPTDIAIADDGSFYVSDGYGNSRVVKFSASGECLFEWGTAGANEGEFDIPHGITLDKNGNVYVADRENSRIQVFDPNGKFIQQYADKSFGNICAVTIDPITQKLFSVDDLNFLKLKHRGSDVIIFEAGGKAENRFGRSGSYNGPVCWYHDIAVDDAQNIYIGDILGNTLQKFRLSGRESQN